MQLDEEELSGLASILRLEPEQLELVRASGLTSTLLGDVRQVHQLPGSDWLGKELFERNLVTLRQALWLDELRADSEQQRSLRLALEAATKALETLVPNVNQATLQVEKAEKYSSKAIPDHSPYPFPESYDGWNITLSYRDESVGTEDELPVVTVSRSLSKILGGGPRRRATVKVSRTGSMISYQAN